jgi:hypothetical protein
VRLLIDAGANKDAKDNVRRRSQFCWDVFQPWPAPLHAPFASFCFLLSVLIPIFLCNIVPSPFDKVPPSLLPRRFCCLGDGQSDAQSGCSALICAATMGRADCVRLLIDAGANKDIMNNVRIGRCSMERILVSLSCCFFHFLCQRELWTLTYSLSHRAALEIFSLFSDFYMASDVRSRGRLRLCLTVRINSADARRLA